MRRILFLAQAEVLHVVRDRATLAQVLVLPIVQLLILSNAATFEIRNTPIYVVDLDRTQRVARAGQPLRRVRTLPDRRAVGVARRSPTRRCSRATSRWSLTIPHDFEASLVRTGSAPVQLVGQRRERIGRRHRAVVRVADSSRLRGGAERRDAAGAGDDRGWRQAEPPPRARRSDASMSRVRGWYNPTLNYQHYMVPGILVALVTMIGTLLSAQNIAREKELGTLEQLNVTPITRGQFIAAKLLPFWVLGLIDLAIGLIVGRLVFGIPMRGSLLLLFGAAAIYLVVALGIGLWISTLVDTQQQAMFVTFFIVNIYLLMSGLFTPIDSMAPWVQPSRSQPGAALRDDLARDPDQGRRAGGDRPAIGDPGRLCRGHVDRGGPAILQAGSLTRTTERFRARVVLRRSNTKAVSSFSGNRLL